MKTADIARVVAKIKFLPIYTCKCGTRQQGDTMHMEIDTTDPTTLFTAFSKQRLTAHAMPVGWGSYYAPEGDDFRCPACIKGESK